MRSGVVVSMTPMKTTTSNMSTSKTDPGIVAVLTVTTTPLDRTLYDFGDLANIDGRDIGNMLADGKILSILQN